jgi:hypothetical protein
MSKSTTLAAVKLLGRWTELSGRHIAMGTGCSCGPGFASVQLKDFEEQLLDYLRQRHGEIVGTSMTALLQRLAKTSGRGTEALLSDVARSLDSFDELHRISPGAGSAPLG